MADTDKKSNTVGFKSRGSTASLKLRAIQPDGTASELFLVDGLTIGRTNANSLQACDDEAGSVERSHARVDFEDSGFVVLKCLQPNAGIDTSGGTVSTLKLEPGTAFKIGRTEFEVVAGPTAEQVSLASGGRGCPYCGHADLPEERGVATRCSECGNSIVVVSPDQNLGVPTFLPGIFHDGEARKYSVERFVARGGMGYVLKGEIESGTAVAIKVLILDGNTQSQAVSRFKQEIDLLRKLHDPNVLRLISHGQEAGLFFFVMDWVDGHDLRSELPKPGKPETYVDYAKARDWFEQACEGLSTIHRAGVVHRDIKPSNLLLTREGKLLIADLGVAKQLNGSETSMTCTGQLPGTYFYMAPEQHYAPDLVDQRSDIYSLGFTFWELLTGVRPNGVNPSPPSSVNHTVPKEFDDILLAMLANSIKDRPSTMREVLRSLPPPISRPMPEQESVALPGSAADKSKSLESQPPDKPRPPAATEPFVQRVAGDQSSTAPDYIDRLATALRQGDALAKERIAYLRPRIQELVAYLIRRRNLIGFCIAIIACGEVSRLLDSVRPGASVTNSIGMELIEIPAGKFTMGSPEDEQGRGRSEAQVTVTLTKPFGLGKTEVTQGQWKSVMGTEPWDGQNFLQSDKDCPATHVSWDDATEFCKKLTDLERKSGKLKADEEYRLPTEAQWECACRAGTTTAFSFGDESKLNAHAWWGGFDLEALKKGENKAGPGNAAREQYAHKVGTKKKILENLLAWMRQREQYAHKVGTKKPNPWGLHDMHGNVYEWCSDWYEESLSGGNDPKGPSAGSGRVIRGGYWSSRASYCRSAYRYSSYPTYRSNYFGFRIVRVLL